MFEYFKWLKADAVFTLYARTKDGFTETVSIIDDVYASFVRSRYGQPPTIYKAQKPDWCRVGETVDYALLASHGFTELTETELPF